LEWHHNIKNIFPDNSFTPSFAAFKNAPVDVLKDGARAWMEQNNKKETPAAAPVVSPVVPLAKPAEILRKLKTIQNPYGVSLDPSFVDFTNTSRPTGTSTL
jgi:hypothetical protein